MDDIEINRTESYYNSIARELREVEDHNEHLLARLAVVKQALDTLPAPSSALDVGCGNGKLAQVLHERGIRVVGIDMSEGSLRIAEARFAAEAPETAPRFIRMDATAAHSLGTFDLVTSTEMLEHVPDPLAVLTAMRRAVGSDGHALVTVPNKRNLHGFMKWWHVRIQGRAWSVPKDDWFTFGSLARLAGQAGWRITWRSGAYFYPPYPLDRIYRGLERRSYTRWMTRSLERFMPWEWGLYCIVLLKPTETSK